MDQGVGTEQVARAFQDRYGLIVAVARRFAPSPDLAYDVAQQSFVDFFEYAQQGKVDWSRDVSPLLHRIAKFRALKLWEDRSRQFGDAYRDIAEQLAEEPEDDHESEEFRALRFCLEKLPPQSRELIERHYFHGDSLNDLAHQKERTPGALRQALYAIRLKLRECIEKRS
jgi:RNA polymerase sigma-70 factor (ECF subfamily)